MKKRIRKLFKHGFLVLLALVTFLLILTPMSVLSNDVLIAEEMSNNTNKNMDEDFRLFCLTTLPEKDYANKLETIKGYQDYNYEISPQLS